MWSKLPSWKHTITDTPSAGFCDFKYEAYLLRPYDTVFGTQPSGCIAFGMQYTGVRIPATVHSCVCVIVRVPEHYKLCRCRADTLGSSAVTTKQLLSHANSKQRALREAQTYTCFPSNHNRCCPYYTCLWQILSWPL